MESLGVDAAVGQRSCAHFAGKRRCETPLRRDTCTSLATYVYLFGETYRRGIPARACFSGKCRCRWWGFCFFLLCSGDEKRKPVLVRAWVLVQLFPRGKADEREKNNNKRKTNSRKKMKSCLCSILRRTRPTAA